MASIVKSFALSGVDAYEVDVETKTIEGQPLISRVGKGLRRPTTWVNLFLPKGTGTTRLPEYCRISFRPCSARLSS